MEKDKIILRYYDDQDEKEWLDVHAMVMVDSYAWWVAIHKKPCYEKETIDLVAQYVDKIIGFITVEINSKVVPFQDAGFVCEFGVHRDYRDHDIGMMLIKKAHKLLKVNFNIKKSLWYSQDEKSQKYYEHIGMKEIDRHWQFSIYPDEKIKKIFEKDGFKCWTIRGECPIESFENIKDKYNIVEDNDPINPRICVGYEFVL